MTWASRLAFIAAVLLWAWTSRAGGQACHPMTDITPATALARTMVRESGLRAYQRDDGTAIHAVIEFRAEHIYRSSYVESVRRYTRGGPVNVRAPRPWITQLWPDGREPALYPSSWARNRVHWSRTYQHALDARRGDVGHRCGLTPHTWGNYHDARRFRRQEPTATELDCGQTCTLNDDGSIRRDRTGAPMCNYFFHLPRYARFDEV
jgi:hypothetical protein